MPIDRRGVRANESRGLAQRSAPESVARALAIADRLVGVAEIADKTRLLALVLAARLRKPWPMILGIFVAMLLGLQVGL